MNPNFSYSSSEISLNEYALLSLLSSIAVFFFPFSNLFTSVTVFVSFYPHGTLPSSVFCASVVSVVFRAPSAGSG